MKVISADVLRHTGLVDWLAGGERGVSSNTIVEVLLGIPAAVCGQCHPIDPSDFRRCERLLRLVPTLRPLMPAMATVSPAWSALVEHWDELVQMLEAEAPGAFGDEAPWRFAPRTYTRMKQLGC